MEGVLVSTVTGMHGEVILADRRPDDGKLRGIDRLQLVRDFVEFLVQTCAEVLDILAMYVIGPIQQP